MEASHLHVVEVRLLFYRTSTRDVAVLSLIREREHAHVGARVRDGDAAHMHRHHVHQAEARAADVAEAGLEAPAARILHGVDNGVVARVGARSGEEPRLRLKVDDLAASAARRSIDCVAAEA